MKTLILARHAKTEMIYHGISDFQRSLKKNRGINDSRLIANRLVKKNIIPDLMISSPANRAIETAQLFAPIFNYPEDNIITMEFLYNYHTTNDFTNMIQKIDNKYKTVMVIGHNPSMADLGYRFANEFDHHLPTSGTIGIEFNVNTWKDIEPGKGRLGFYEYPSMYK